MAGKLVCYCFGYLESHIEQDVRVALMKPSLSIPMIEGKMQLGTWQQIVFINFDNRPRKREVVVQVMGIKQQ